MQSGRASNLKSRLRSAAAVLLATSAAVAFTGCSRQNEGERCSLTNGNSDCDDGLVCTEADDLKSKVDEVNRCCPGPGEPVSDARCEPAGGDSSGIGGAGGDLSSEGPQAGLGDDCIYDSDCEAPLSCVTGACRAECQTSRDCSASEICSGAQICVAP